ncbi:hypothetical protein ACP275_10G184100 [Erythranthe tilingii]
MKIFFPIYLYWFRLVGVINVETYWIPSSSLFLTSFLIFKYLSFWRKATLLFSEKFFSIPDSMLFFYQKNISAPQNFVWLFALFCSFLKNLWWVIGTMRKYLSALRNFVLLFLLTKLQFYSVSPSLALHSRQYC